jgi:hypothetical protein
MQTPLNSVRLLDARQISFVPRHTRLRTSGGLHGNGVSRTVRQQYHQDCCSPGWTSPFICRAGGKKPFNAMEDHIRTSAPILVVTFFLLWWLCWICLR